ncbi:MAG TPA: hypothetical protein PLW68_03700 [Casimicrobiaceae bacterium]|nr:hypothetical protein [Casimicrobiaceae bacterium]
MLRTLFLAIAIAVLAACSPAPVDKSPIRPTPPGDAAVVRRPLAETPAASATLVPPSTAAAAAGIVIPADALYVCVSERGGSRQTTAIEFAPKVGALCAKNPEMGPCQYERNICRAGGGRVYAANGAEITAQTEAEYDKKVMRVRFKSN